MTPQDYLGKYCRVSPRRQTLFKRIFDKYQNHRGEIGKEVRREVKTSSDERPFVCRI